jgi:acyl carrier protein
MASHPSQQLLTAISEASGIPEEHLRADMTIEELGLDSLDVLHLLAVLDIPADEIDGIGTIADLESHLSQRKLG